MARGPDLKPRKARTDGHKPSGPGPGRPKGSVGSGLPRNAVGAIKGLRYRVPEDAPEVLAEIADECLEVAVDVLRGKHRLGGGQRLGAVKILRDEICGPVAQRHEVSVTDTLSDRIREARERVDREG